VAGGLALAWSSFLIGFLSVICSIVGFGYTVINYYFLPSGVLTSTSNEVFLDYASYKLGRTLAQIRTVH
jgi:hypothetical protein